MTKEEQISQLIRLSGTIRAIVDFKDEPTYDQMIAELKQDMLKFVVPCDIHVVYKSPRVYQGGLEKEPIGFFANPTYANDHAAHEIGEMEYDERKGVRITVETETLE